jgi:hypothetical protein
MKIGNQGPGVPEMECLRKGFFTVAHPLWTGNLRSGTPSGCWCFRGAAGGLRNRCDLRLLPAKPFGLNKDPEEEEEKEEEEDWYGLLEPHHSDFC